ncbi:metallo-beta-lactamase superfamily protein [Syntrophobotulus glycolicus DSM 8271]|uniref:Metallo-beta-lactamase superfamily protein n=1 Tax=Syntrophobotulus glycolicus (strain DSM 8271 / FlGlyR) TaxID=645991 RepID=F0T260_SYNGF|nr:MBL fold metallo-hydrolase [Syntrophobotulus glycolicus]ADY56404.1 metallo-beta-lactamase superfamily protein [Syntrophobotulus glycolicus DSM 8271]
MKMKLTILGRWGAYPEAGESTAGYLLQTDRGNYLLDCGSGVLSKAWQYITPGELKGVFLSHFHQDHKADLGCLQYAMKFALVFGWRQDRLKIYANKKEPHFPELFYDEYTAGIGVESGDSLEIDGLRVSFQETVHDGYNLAMRFEYGGKVLIYTGDMGPKSELTDFCRGADLLLGETSLFEEESGMVETHMTTKELALLAEKAQAKNLILTHFPHKGDLNRMPREASRYFSGAVRLAEIGDIHQI